MGVLQETCEYVRGSLGEDAGVDQGCLCDKDVVHGTKYCKWHQGGKYDPTFPAPSSKAGSDYRWNKTIRDIIAQKTTRVSVTSSVQAPRIKQHAIPTTPTHATSPEGTCTEEVVLDGAVKVEEPSPDSLDVNLTENISVSDSSGESLQDINTASRCYNRFVNAQHTVSQKCTDS